MNHSILSRFVSCKIFPGRPAAAWFGGVACLCSILFPAAVRAIGEAQYVETSSSKGSFAIVRRHSAAGIYVDQNDYAGVIRAAGDLRADVERVTGVLPVVTNQLSATSSGMILIGTIGKSGVID